MYEQNTWKKPKQVYLFKKYLYKINVNLVNVDL